MKKLLFAAAAALVLATGLSACQTVVVQESAGEEDLTLRVVCQSPEVYQLYYTLYLDGEEYCQGGWGDIDGAPLTAQSDLTALFPQGYFEGRDLSGLAVDLSPYGEGGYPGDRHHPAGEAPRPVRRMLYHPLYRG